MVETDPQTELAEIDTARRKDRVAGLLVVIVAFALGMGVSLWAKRASRPELAEPPGPPSTDGIAGFPSDVDVIKSLPAARNMTKRTLLRNIYAEGVRSDGTVDLGEGPGRARYTFQSTQGDGPQPPREPGTLPRRHYCGKQTVHLRKEGLVADPDVTDYPCPTVLLDPLPEPRCTFQQIWAQAIRDGAPRNRMARIEYYRSKAGPAWRFELPGTDHRFALYGDCARKLTDAEAAQLIP
jgi:hypothetical protein